MAKASKRFRDNLKSLCEKKQLSQIDLAHRSGLHNVFICRVFRGHQSPSLDVAERLAIAAGSDLKKILAESH